MPIKKSAKKYMKVAARKTVQNKEKKVKFREAIKKVLSLTKEGKKVEAKKTLSSVQKALDKAVKKGIIKKNTASRKKSRLSKAIKKIS